MLCNKCGATEANGFAFGKPVHFCDGGTQEQKGDKVVEFIRTPKLGRLAQRAITAITELVEELEICHAYSDDEDEVSSMAETCVSCLDELRDSFPQVLLNELTYVQVSGNGFVWVGQIVGVDAGDSVFPYLIKRKGTLSEASWTHYEGVEKISKEEYDAVN